MDSENKRIILNQIQTPDGTILRSMHRHDYVTYIDKNGLEYMVDGGSDYLRRNVHEKAPHKEMSVYADAPFSVIRSSFHRGGRGKDGKQPLTWVPMDKMSDAWLLACIKYNKDLGMDDSFASELYRKEVEYRKTQGITVSDED